MKFPGKRKSKHYFPVNAHDPLLQQFQPEHETSAAWVVGIDQTLVEIEAKIPKPTNPQLLPQADDFSQRALDLLNLSDADNLTFKVGIDQRYAGMNRRLANWLKNSVRTISQYDPQKLTAKIDENGVVSPIDLLADRIKSIQKVEATGRYISRDALYQAIE